MKVLIAEDRPTTRYILHKKLNEWGYEVIEAEDGLKAWAVLSEPDPPRIAIVDWMMPGYDGVTICRMLKERRDAPFIYTILLTSKSLKEDLVFALENGAHNFQSKPISPEELRSHINVGRHLVEADDKLTEYATQMERLAEQRAQQLVHADRLAMLGTLSAGITHEIGNPLTFIIGNLKLMENYWKELEPYFRICMRKAQLEDKHILTMIHSFTNKIWVMKEGTDRIRSIINTMRAFSRKDTGKERPSNIEHCIEEAFKICHNAIKYNLTVIKNYEPNLPKIMINPQQIEQVLINLFTNAADAVKDMREGQLIVTTAQQGDYLTIKVEDTGPGISEEDLKHIFQPFYTTKDLDRGTGLGLYISRSIIEHHQGTISVENRDQGGAKFTIRLPISPEPLPDSKTS